MKQVEGKGMKQVEGKGQVQVKMKEKKSLPIPLPVLLPILLLISVFGLFLATIHPSITAGDSAEISAAVCSLGIPHPSGYPLYLLVAKLFTSFLPFGNIAYRVNMVSAIFGALSCMVVYLITERIVQGKGIGRGIDVRSSLSLPRPSPLPAAFAAPSFALSYEFWYRSSVAEVYTLNTFLTLAIIHVLLVWRERSLEGRGGFETRPYSSHYLYLASFLLGLGIGNHHTIVLVVPGALLFVLLTGRGEGAGKGKDFSLPIPIPVPLSVLAPAFTVAFFLLGLSIYLYLPIRSFQNPFMDWGDPQNVRNFIDVFTRKEYLPEKIGRDWKVFINHLMSFNLIREFTASGLCFGMIGIWGAWRRDNRTAILLLLTAILTSYGLIVLVGSSKADTGLLRKFYLPSYAVFSIFMGVGIAAILNSRWMGSLRLTPHASRITLLLAGVSLVWQFSVHYPWLRNSDNYLAYDYGMNELNSLREGSVYISKGEIKTFPLWYLQGVERYREDVSAVTAYFLTQRWYLAEVLRITGVPGEFSQDLTYKQILINSIYLKNAGKGAYTGFLDEGYIPKNLLTYSNGLTFQLYKKPEERSAGDVWSIYRLRGVERVEGWMDRGTVEILKDYASSHYNTGLESFNDGDIDRAMVEFEKAVAINPDDPDSLNNLAALYAEKGIKLKEAEGLVKKAFELYTEEKDKELARETIEEIEKKMRGPI